MKVVISMTDLCNIFSCLAEQIEEDDKFEAYLRRNICKNKRDLLKLTCIANGYTLAKKTQKSQR